MQSAALVSGGTVWKVPNSCARRAREADAVGDDSPNPGGVMRILSLAVVALWGALGLPVACWAQGTLPSNGNYSVVNTDSAGNRTVQSSDSSILTQSVFAYTYKSNGNVT